ncbi:MAG: hypothetical protein ACHQ9S_00850 [Candidatus Binatia bacterium]
MATGHIEERVAALEAEIVRLKKRLNRGAISRRPWWEEIAGGFANDPIFEEAMKLGQQYRRSLRPKPSGPRRKRNGHPRVGTEGRQLAAWGTWTS